MHRIKPERNTPITKLSGERVRNCFKDIIWYFNALGIPISPQSGTTRRVQKLIWKTVAVIHHFLSILTLLMFLSSLYFCETYDIETKRHYYATLFFVIFGITLRYALYMKRMAIGKLIYKISRFPPSVFTFATLRKTRQWVRISLFFTFIIMTTVPSLFRYVNFSNQEYKKTFLNDYFFGLLNGLDSSTSDLIASLFLNVWMISSFIHMYVFAVLYSVLVLCISKLFKAISADAIKNNLDVTQIQNLYDKINGFVEEMDSTFNFTVFLTFVLASHMLYYPIVAMNGIGPNALTLLPSSILCVGNIVSISSMCFFASKVYTSSKEIKPYLHCLNGTFSSKLWLGMTLDTPPYLTIWNIFPLTKSVIFGYLGTVITYSLIIDSMLVKST